MKKVATSTRSQPPPQPLENRSPALRDLRYKVQVELDTANELLGALALDTRIPLHPPEEARAALRKVVGHVSAASNLLDGDVKVELERLLGLAQAQEDARSTTVTLKRIDAERLHAFLNQLVVQHNRMFESNGPSISPSRVIHRLAHVNVIDVVKPVISPLGEALK